MYAKGSAVMVGAAAALFAATNLRAIALVVAIVITAAMVALVVRRLALHR
jgi:hypothetical protein